MGLAALGLALGACSPASRRAEPPPEPVPLPARVEGANLRPVADAHRGYGSGRAIQTMTRLKGLGVNTLGILLEGRLTDAKTPEVRLPSHGALEAAREGLDDARALGLATVLIPHIYVEDGTWRGSLDFEGPEASRFWASYGDFIAAAADIADRAGATVLSLGVELKTLSAQPSSLVRMGSLSERVRGIYGGLLTYGANWDEMDDVVFWSAVDLAGVNGYFPLTPSPNQGAETVARSLASLSRKAGREVLLLEVGYRSSPLSHERPWEWPEQVHPVVDETAQARAWAAALGHWMDAPGVRGLLVWVVPTDPEDPEAEPKHGFNPLGKAAELVIERAFHD